MLIIDNGRGPAPAGQAPFVPVPLPGGPVPFGPAICGGPLPFGPVPLGPAICGGPLPSGPVPLGPAPGAPNAFASGLQNLSPQPMYSSAAPIQSWMAGVADPTTDILPNGGALMVHAGTDTNFQGPGHRLPWVLDGLYGAPVRFDTVRRGSS